MNKDIFRLPSWSQFSKKLKSKIENQQFGGYFDNGRGMRLVIGREGHNIAMYWLVDESDGIIADIRYQVFGPPALIGALEAASGLLLRKNHDQARRVTADLIDREMRDKPDIEAFPPEAYAFLNAVLCAIENAADQCSDIPFDEVYTSSPLHPEAGGAGPYPGWENLSASDKLTIIEQIIEQEIRPYIELDAGGIQILNLSDKYELTIAYQGSCTSCYSATGSTLQAIQQILQARVHPNIQVIPDLSFLKQDST